MSVGSDHWYHKQLLPRTDKLKLTLGTKMCLPCVIMHDCTYTCVCITKEACFSMSNYVVI